MQMQLIAQLLIDHYNLRTEIQPVAKINLDVFGPIMSVTLVYQQTATQGKVTIVPHRMPSTNVQTGLTTAVYVNVPNLSRNLMLVINYLRVVIKKSRVTIKKLKFIAVHGMKVQQNVK